jgi:hypothetical protein
LASLHARTSALLRQAGRHEQPSKLTHPRQRQHQLTPAEAAAIAQQYQAGADMCSLAATFDVHRTTISECLHQQGVLLRRQGLRDEDVAEAAQLYQASWSLAQLGEKYDCVHTAVRKKLLDRGVELRPRPGWSY